MSGWEGGEKIDPGVWTGSVQTKTTSNSNVKKKIWLGFCFCFIVTDFGGHFSSHSASGRNVSTLFGFQKMRERERNSDERYI